MQPIAAFFTHTKSLSRLKLDTKKNKNMKKNFFRALALSALLALGAQNSFAQRPYEVEPIDPEYKAMADEINNIQIDDPDKASKLYLKLLNKIKNSKDNLMSVGNYCLDNGYIQLAEGCARQLYKIRPQYIEGLIFYGETLAKKQDWSQAGSKYEAILALDENNTYAIKRCAWLYKNINPYQSLEYLNKLLELDPNNYDVYKQIGDLYYDKQMQDYAKAVENYGKYYDNTVSDPSKLDIAACESYLNVLYAMSQQDEANIDKMISVAKVVKGLAPKDIIPARMLFFGLCNKIGKGSDYPGEIQAATDAEAYILNKTFADSVYINMDYEMAATLAGEKDQNMEAINFYGQAIKALDYKMEKAQNSEDEDKDPKTIENTKLQQAGYYREQARLYSIESKFDECFAAYGKYQELKGDKLDAADFLQIGNSYTTAYNRTEDNAEKKAQYFDKANEYYDKCTAFEMTNHRSRLLAYQRQARLNNTDNQKPLDNVRDYYLKVIEVGSEPELQDVSVSSRFEACRYLFFYYVSVEPVDKENATKYAQMAKDLNYEEGADMVKNFFDYLQTL